MNNTKVQYFSFGKTGSIYVTVVTIVEDVINYVTVVLLWIRLSVTLRIGFSCIIDFKKRDVMTLKLKGRTLSILNGSMWQFNN